MHEIRLLDELAAAAWPSSATRMVGGWRLRRTPGVRARRSNSVLPLDGPPGGALDPALELVERYYRGDGIEPRFQISPSAEPEGLDAVLAARRYRVEAPVDIQTAVLQPVIGATDTGALGDVTIEPAAGAAWLALFTDLFARGSAQDLKTKVLDRIEPPAAYALLRRDGRPASLGLGVADRGWVGIFSMGTVEHARRRGAATAVVGALARWAADRGATRAYLQVEAENEPAHRLYERLGFRTRYGYHYRTLGV